MLDSFRAEPGRRTGAARVWQNRWLFISCAPKYIVTADGRHRHKSAEGIQYEKRDIQRSADQARSSALLFPTIFFVPILYPSSFSFREFFQSLYSFLLLPILAFSQQHFIRLIYCSCILTTRPAHFFEMGKIWGEELLSIWGRASY